MVRLFTKYFGICSICNDIKRSPESLEHTKTSPVFCQGHRERYNSRRPSYGHFVTSGEKFLKGFYLKIARAKQISKKKVNILPTPIVFAPDEVCDTYIDISDDLHLDLQSF